MSRPVVEAVMKSPGAAAEEGVTVGQRRLLVMLGYRRPQRMAEVAAAPGVAPSSAGRMCDRLARQGQIAWHRARGDLRVVLVSVAEAGRQLTDAATGRHRALAAGILDRLPLTARLTVPAALRQFADAAGETSGRRLRLAPAGLASVPRPRPPACGGEPARAVPLVRAGAEGRS